jgi:transcriptional regulator with XRE-family HTH domain
MELALSAGLAHNSINDIENCKKGISCKSIAKLCMALRAEPYQFFLPEDIPDDKISVYINELKDSVQKAVNDVTSQYIQANDKNTV